MARSKNTSANWLRYYTYLSNLRKPKDGFVGFFGVLRGNGLLGYCLEDPEGYGVLVSDTDPVQARIEIAEHRMRLSILESEAKIKPLEYFVEAHLSRETFLKALITMGHNLAPGLSDDLKEFSKILLDVKD